MAKKKKIKKVKEVSYLEGYVPSSFVPSSITNNQILQIPPYPDESIKYAGYAKKFGSNGYILLKQDQSKAYYGFTWTGSSSTLTNPIKQINNKNLYYKRLVISCYTDTACYFDIAESPTGKFLGSVTCGAGQTNSITIEYDGGNKVSTSLIQVTPSVGVTAHMEIDVFGWYEQVV